MSTGRSLLNQPSWKVSLKEVSSTSHSSYADILDAAASFHYFVEKASKSPTFVEVRRDQSRS